MQDARLGTVRRSKNDEKRIAGLHGAQRVRAKRITKRKGKKKKTNNSTKKIQPLLLGNVCKKEEKTNKKNNN